MALCSARRILSVGAWLELELAPTAHVAHCCAQKRGSDSYEYEILFTYIKI